MGTIKFCEECGSQGIGNLYIICASTGCPACGGSMITIDETEKYLYPHIKGTIFETPLFDFLEQRRRTIKANLSLSQTIIKEEETN